MWILPAVTTFRDRRPTKGPGAGMEQPCGFCLRGGSTSSTHPFAPRCFGAPDFTRSWYFACVFMSTHTRLPAVFQVEEACREPQCWSFLSLFVKNNLFSTVKVFEYFLSLMMTKISSSKIVNNTSGGGRTHDRWLIRPSL